MSTVPADLAGDRAGRVFDRVGDRAWQLAVWIAPDAAIASQALAETLARPLDETGMPRSDAALICAVRRRAVRLVDVLPPAASPLEIATRATRLAHAVRLLAEPQREAIELAIIARLSVAEISEALALPQTAVVGLLGEAMRALASVRGMAAATLTVRSPCAPVARTPEAREPPAA